MAKSLKNKKNTVSKKKIDESRLRIGLYWLVFLILAVGAVSALLILNSNKQHKGAQQLSSFKAKPFSRIRTLAKPSVAPHGISPANIKLAYGLQSAGSGHGTIAIIDAFDDPAIESDLATFSRQYRLPSCTTKNHCFEKHLCQYTGTANNCVKNNRHIRKVGSSSSWAIEVALDVEWAHAIAPGAKILLVSAKTNSGTDLLNAVDYARSRKDVVAVSMSWGGDEFSGEGLFENHFVSSQGATFFASSGDSGHGVSWPAVSANVVGVGGTTVRLSGGVLSSETAWSGSGGGLSAYIPEPGYQSTYGVANASGKRAVPDVSYAADPAGGLPVYNSVRFGRSRGWFIVGGTSAGAPQWAALRAISPNVTATKLYADAAATDQTKLADIASGSNGSCGVTYCSASIGYDYVTGLGSPRGASF